MNERSRLLFSLIDYHRNRIHRAVVVNLRHARHMDTQNLPCWHESQVTGAAEHHITLLFSKLKLQYSNLITMLTLSNKQVGSGFQFGNSFCNRSAIRAISLQPRYHIVGFLDTVIPALRLHIPVLRNIAL